MLNQKFKRLANDIGVLCLKPSYESRHKFILSAIDKYNKLKVRYILQALISLHCNSPVSLLHWLYYIYPTG